MITNAYKQLEDNPIDAIDAAVFTGDMFMVRANREHFREMMRRWEAELKSYEEIDERWKRECTHPNATREENLVGEGAMEYVQWYDCYCPACGKKWTEN